MIRARAGLVLGQATAFVIAVAVGCSAGGGNPSSRGQPSGGGAGGFLPSAGGTGGAFPALNQGGAFFIPDDAGTRLGSFDAGSPTTPVVIDECTGVLDPGAIAKLRGAGDASGMNVLYPYPGTIFPRGLVAPVLQWNPAGAIDAGLVHLKSKTFEYTGCFKGLALGQYQLSKTAWDGAGARSGGSTDPLTIEITTMTGGAVHGPLRETVTFALASLQGAIYYNSYDSKIAGANGAVLRLLPGDSKPSPYLVYSGASTPLLGPCVGCHALSANGTRMVAARHNYNFAATDPSLSYSYDVSPSATPAVIANVTPLEEIGFGAVYPDGSMAMAMGSPSDSSLLAAIGLPIPFGPENVVGMNGPRVAKLLDLKTGAELKANGWDGVIQYAKMPEFSPDGRHIVFNHHEDSDGHSLAVMDFDAATTTFSNLREIYRATDTTQFPGWPFFAPDSKHVVFVVGNSTRYDSGYLFGSPRGVSDLYVIDASVLGSTATLLSEANGYGPSGLYLPGGANDEHLEFFPTVSPVAAGGYFWLFFTSRRTYGNVMTLDASSADSKKIWVAAIDMNAPAGTDPSHPAFFLPGQEIDSGNIRAFATLEPCHEDGQACTSGTQCCKGYCTNGVCTTPMTHTCSADGDACKQDSDCCNSRDVCIAGFCELEAPE